jgi:hypothetical protein
MNDGNVVPPIPVPSQRPAPRPGVALLDALKQAEPVRTRAPYRTVAIVALAALAYPIYVVTQFPLRKDLSALPMGWFIPVALLWLAGFILPLTLALLPVRGQVLPNEGRAGRVAIVFAVALTLVGLFTIDAPGRTLMPANTWDDFWHYWWHCIFFGMRIVLPALVAGTVALARVMLVGAARLGAAIGAAGGALTGLTLHGLCPIGGVLHAMFAHGGAVVIGALLGALMFPLVQRLASRLRL